MLINDQNTERDVEFAAGNNILPFLRPHYVPGTYCSSTLQISPHLTLQLWWWWYCSVPHFTVEKTWGTERLSKLPQVTQEEKSRNRSHAQAVWFFSLLSGSPLHTTGRTTDRSTKNQKGQRSGSGCSSAAVSAGLWDCLGCSPCPCRSRLQHGPRPLRGKKALLLVLAVP